MSPVPGAVIGFYPSGVIGLKTSLPGFNALTDDDNDANKFSFNSEWTDIEKVHLTGIATAPTSFAGLYDIPIPALPYIPFVEMRAFSGNVINDDFLTVFDPNGAPTNRAGVPFSLTTSSIRLGFVANNQLLYVVLKDGI